jgi:type VI protein secretion system component VasK
MAGFRPRLRCFWNATVAISAIDDPIERKCSGSGDDTWAAMEMVFEAFAFLISRPVHGKAVRGVYFDDGDQHVARDSEAGDAAEENRKSARASLEIRP